MRVLTVRQPWAWAIIHGGKDVENRVRNIAGGYRGPIAIQAGAARFEDDGQFHEVRRAIRTEELGWPAEDGEVWAADAVEPEDPRFVYGAIIGVVYLVEVHSPAADLTRDDFCQGPTGDLCSAWAQIESWHLVLANPRALAEPIPYRGALGLRHLDDDTIARIEGALV